ncbi:MAG: HPr family phosphocarrier protein [Gemmatimonas sp.]|jgi:phosphocarrier protein HPr
MAERSVQIVNKHGLHARPAAEMVKAASRFKSDITISRDDLEVNGKSIMGVMMLAAEYGATIVLKANGPDADESLEALAALVAARFGER